MTILQVNLQRGKKFLISGMLFGFCMARIATLTLRLAWSTHLTNIPLAIAAQIFVALGVIILFVINIIFAQRLLRSSHSHFAWRKSFSLVFKIYYASIVAVIVMLVTCTVQTFYTRDKNILRIDRDVTLFGGTYFAVAAFMPIPLLALRAILPKRNKVDKFGSGRIRSKVLTLLFSSSILSLGAAFRIGVNFMPRPANNPAWYHSKACFYIFNFTIEWIVVALYVVIRVDRRFIVPNGAHGPGSYTVKGNEGEEQGPAVFRVRTEEEVFDDEVEEPPVSTEKADRDLEAQPAVAVSSTPNL